MKVSRNGIASIRARSESFIALKAPSCQSHYFYRYGTKGRRRWGDWHHMSKVTPAETGKIELDLEPELASDLITSLSSDNKWVDIYQTDRFRHLTLTHLSGNSNHGSKKLCFHWKAWARENFLEHNELLQASSQFLHESWYRMPGCNEGDKKRLWTHQKSASRLSRTYLAVSLASSVLVSIDENAVFVQ